MKSLLLGNGINIQFGGKAYSNRFIMERIRFRAKLDGYLELFDNTLAGGEIVGLLDGFVDIANGIRNGEYDKFAHDADISAALTDFKRRYANKITVSYEIMLEDWFFLIRMFFLKNDDLRENMEGAIQGFERLVLDAIYNDGKIQKLYLNVSKSKKVRQFFKSYDNIFTLNYDNNIEMLTKQRVFHLHGDFSVLANSEDPMHVQGYIRSQKNDLAIVYGMEHCFCNALLNYSGRLKYTTAKTFHNLIVASADFAYRYSYDPVFQIELSNLKKEKPFEYQMIMTKIQHPELNIATEYYFDQFERISDEVHIIGMSPNNDEHIFNLILSNKSIQKVIFYYFSETERHYIEEQYPANLFECRSVQSLWKLLDCDPPRYNCKYSIPQDIDPFIKIFNALSGSPVTKEEVLKEISQIPQFEMNRLCELVEQDISRCNPEHKSTDKAEFDRSRASISYIALQEGILPSTLYMIYTMNARKS